MIAHLPYFVALWLLFIGIYGAVTSRNLIHLITCISVSQSGSYVMLLALGDRPDGAPPILGSVPQGRRMVDPVVQALVLTDIVVGVTIAALLLALAVQAYKRFGTLDPEKLRELRR